MIPRFYASLMPVNSENACQAVNFNAMLVKKALEEGVVGAERNLRSRSIYIIAVLKLRPLICERYLNVKENDYSHSAYNDLYCDPILWPGSSSVLLLDG
jgi:hypothetical protein